MSSHQGLGVSAYVSLKTRIVTHSAAFQIIDRYIKSSLSQVWMVFANILTIVTIIIIIIIMEFPLHIYSHRVSRKASIRSRMLYHRWPVA